MEVKERSNTSVLQVMRQTKRENIPFQELLYPDCFVYSSQDILIPHALAVSPEYHKKGIGKKTVEEILRYAKSRGKKAVRLDVLGTNTATERLYTKCGFDFVQTKAMFYEDTGLTEYKLYEFNFI